MRKGSDLLLAAGVLSLIIGGFGTILMISSFANNINKGTENISVLILAHISNPLFYISIIILVLGILIISKRNKKEWGHVFFIMGCGFRSDADSDSGDMRTGFR